MDDVVSAARTVPMMAPRRFVLLRGAERWDAAGGGHVAVRSARRVRGRPGRHRRAWSSSPRSSTGGASSPSDRPQAGLHRRVRPARRPRPAGVDRRSLRGQGPRGRPRRRRAAGGARRAAALLRRRRPRAAVALRGPGQAGRRGRRGRLRGARAHGGHLGPGRRRGRARSGPRAAHAGGRLRPARARPAAAGSPGVVDPAARALPGGGGRAAPRPTRRRGGRASSSPSARGSWRPRPAPSARRRSSGGCWSSPRPIWR